MNLNSQSVKKGDVHPLVHVAVWVALAASATMGGFGLVSAFWSGLSTGQMEAWIGLGIIIAAFIATEIGAVAISFSIVRDGVTFWRAVLFALFTLSNIGAGHYGAEAFNTRLIAPARAPFEAAVASSGAMVEAAKNGLDATESRHNREREDLERALEAERLASPNYITARGRQAQEQRDAMMARQLVERQTVEAELRAAEETKASAEARFEEAPKGFPLWQTIALAVVIELLKGVFVMAAAPRSRRIKFTGDVLPIDPAAYKEMTEAELQDILSRGRSASALAQHALNRLRKSAA